MATDYITLLGTEDVRSAASRMQEAAHQMERAAASFDEAMRRHERFLEDWLVQFREAMEVKRGD